MGNRIQVDPAQLNAAASHIDGVAAQYQQLYNKLFSDVGAMQAAWQGKDNQAFTSQIEGFKQDFQQMYQLMVEYSNFLKKSAQTYQQAQDDTVSGAQRLSN